LVFSSAAQARPRAKALSRAKRRFRDEIGVRSRPGRGVYAERRMA